MHKDLFWTGLTFILASSLVLLIQEQFLSYLILLIGIFILGVYVGEKKQFEEIKRFEDKIRNRKYEP